MSGLIPASQRVFSSPPPLPHAAHSRLSRLPPTLRTPTCATGGDGALGHAASPPRAAPARALTEPLARPPVRLLDGGELDLGVQPQAVVQVGGAALGLPDDVEARQAAQAEVPAAGVGQVVPEGLAQGVERGAEAPRVERVRVAHVGVGGVPPRELLVPARALAIWKKFGGDYRKHLQRERGDGAGTPGGRTLARPRAARPGAPHPGPGPEAASTVAKR